MGQNGHKPSDTSCQYFLCSTIIKSPNIFVLLLIKEAGMSLVSFVLPSFVVRCHKNTPRITWVNFPHCCNTDGAHCHVETSATRSFAKSCAWWRKLCKCLLKTTQWKSLGFKPMLGQEAGKSWVDGDKTMMWAGLRYSSSLGESFWDVKENVGR